MHAPECGAKGWNRSPQLHAPAVAGSLADMKEYRSQIEVFPGNIVYSTCVPDGRDKAQKERPKAQSSESKLNIKDSLP